MTQREEDFGLNEIGETTVLRIPAHIFCYLLEQAERRLWEPKTMPE